MCEQSASCSPRRQSLTITSGPVPREGNPNQKKVGCEWACAGACDAVQGRAEGFEGVTVVGSPASGFVEKNGATSTVG